MADNRSCSIICPTCKLPGRTKVGYCRPCWSSWVRNERKKRKFIKPGKGIRGGSISLAEWHLLLQFSNLTKGGCALCGSIENLFLDHDHLTGEVRGALCRHCNTALGAFKDSVQELKMAIDYLENPPARRLGVSRWIPSTETLQKSTTP